MTLTSRTSLTPTPDRRETLRTLAVLAVLGPVAGAAAEVVKLYVESDRDLPFFNPDRLSCRAGARIALTFHHAGAIITQNHNWVLVRPGTAEAVELDGLEAGEENGWLRKDDPRVIAATPQIGKGGTVTIEFTAPAPGDYPYICTTPGHAQDMNGILHVTSVS